jgi:hypothetical protein
MADVNNKLGLTPNERIVSYSTGIKNSFAEIRNYDPTYGFLVLHDPMLNTQIDFFWDSGTSTWKGTGIHSGYTVDISVEELAPLVKQTDTDVPAVAGTVSRFPA